MSRSQNVKPVQVVVLGGGFGGRNAAARLTHGLPAGSRVTLVDQNDYLLYTPMLTEVAGRSVSPHNIQSPNSALSKRIEFIQGTVRTANLEARTVELEDGRVLHGDHLVFALGSTTNFRGIEGAQENSLTMKTLEDARRVRTLAQRNVEQAAFEPDPKKKKRLLSFVVAGGGYTGVETVASLNDLVHDTAARHGLPAGEIAITLVEPSKRLMAELPDSLGSYGKGLLESDGIEVVMNDGVQRIDAESLTLVSGKTLSAGIVIWDAGITPSPVIQTLHCEKGKRHGIATDSTFQARGAAGIWAIGDCAEIPKPDGTGTFFEPTAQNATRQGTLVAKNIIAEVYGRPLQPFRYKQIGELAVISRYRGVAYVFGFQVRGVTAWLMWRAIYLAKMPGIRQRVGILSDWIRLAFGRRYVPVTRRPSPRHIEGGHLPRQLAPAKAVTPQDRNEA